MGETSAIKEEDCSRDSTQTRMSAQGKGTFGRFDLSRRAEKGTFVPRLERELGSLGIQRRLRELKINWDNVLCSD
jgi:hypothetical protein